MKKLLLVALTFASLSAFAQTTEAPASAPATDGPSIDTKALSHPTRPANAPAAQPTEDASAAKAAPAKEKAPKAKKHKAKGEKKKSHKADSTEATPAS